MTFERVDERAECSTQKLDEEEEDEDAWQWLVAPRQEETLENILEIPHFFYIWELADIVLFRLSYTYVVCFYCTPSTIIFIISPIPFLSLHSIHLSPTTSTPFRENVHFRLRLRYSPLPHEIPPSIHDRPPPRYHPYPSFSHTRLHPNGHLTRDSAQRHRPVRCDDRGRRYFRLLAYWIEALNYLGCDCRHCARSSLPPEQCASGARYRGGVDGCVRAALFQVAVVYAARIAVFGVVGCSGVLWYEFVRIRRKRTSW